MNNVKGSGTVKRSGVAATFFISFITLFLASCENDINEVNRLFSKDETLVETATGVELLYSDSAKLKLRIASPKLLRHLDKKDPLQEFPDGLMVEFFGPDGLTVTGRMTAKYAERYDNNGKFLVRDSVVWTGSGGERLETQELTWDEENDRVYTTKFVIVRRPSEIIYGHGFESNQKFTEWKIKAIEGRIKAGDITKELRN